MSQGRRRHVAGTLNRHGSSPWSSIERQSDIQPEPEPLEVAAPETESLPEWDQSQPARYDTLEHAARIALGMAPIPRLVADTLSMARARAGEVSKSARYPFHERNNAAIRELYAEILAEPGARDLSLDLIAGVIHRRMVRKFGKTGVYAIATVERRLHALNKKPRK